MAGAARGRGDENGAEQQRSDWQGSREKEPLRQKPQCFELRPCQQKHGVA